MKSPSPNHTGKKGLENLVGKMADRQTEYSNKDYSSLGFTSRGLKSIPSFGDLLLFTACLSLLILFLPTVMKESLVYNNSIKH